jgi:filamentous hemagglutinin family protein
MATRRHFTTAVLAIGMALNAMANPAGMTVASGSAVAQASGSQLTITTSQNAFLNWQSFNIAAGETTIFNQPSASSLVVNNIHDANASQIYGSLQANGIVVLMNPNGFYFGPNSFVKTGGLILSTANCLPPQNSGGAWEFNGPPPLASIINYGQISVGNGGPAFLIADDVENHGMISAPEGDVVLASGQTVLLSERPDGRGVSAQVTLPQGSVNNYGTIVADGGTIAMNAQVVNQNGIVQADSVQNQNGVIELVASDQLNLGANSKILAHGDNSSPDSSGGNVTLQSGNTFSDNVGSQISVAGGSQGGNGGNVEISAPVLTDIYSQFDGSAQSGYAGGTVLLDPVDLTLDSSSLSPYFGFSQILFQASGDITLNADTGWNLSADTGNNNGQLTLEAGGDIIFGYDSFGNSAQIMDANSWSVTLQAGYNFANNSINYGQGSIYLNGGDGQTGGGSIQTGAGNINLVAGQNILVGSGFVITTGGGSISAHALAGDIDTGGDAQGYFFQSADLASQAYNLQDGLGGISTASGGDVSLTAGGDVTSVLPGKNGYYYDGNFLIPNNADYTTAGSGAYGSQLGNVTVVAGGDVTGNYLVANGVGSIFAGVEMDANGNPVKDVSGNYVLGNSGSAGTDQLNPNLALNLVSGGWNVTAAQDIILQEVLNPNGIFNVNSGGAYHYFDYSPGDYVNLSAGNLVQLGASSSALPRLTSVDSLKVPVVYPSILNITAGAGGVILDGDSSYNQLILFPSPQGSLTINTTQGGSLVGNLPPSASAPQIFNLIVSDSSQSQYDSSSGGIFGLNDHAATPVHLNNPTPITLNISGDMDDVLLGAPEAAQINVGGDMNNSRFQGMNLSANDVTSINVGGDINNRSIFTSVDLSQIPGAQAPDLSVLSQAVNNSISEPTLASSFFYNGTTLTYENINGVSLASVLQLLQHLTIQVYANGVPQWADPPYDTIPITTTASVMNTATASALLAQYNALGAIPNNATANGFILGGGGTFEISAQNIDLGTSAGIQSKGVGLYNVRGSYPLANLFGNGGVFDNGADISVNVSGNLNMYSSSIASLEGGNININAGGVINAGSSVFSVNTLGIRGIYSTGAGNVTVDGGGDININGSRIATYDGGNITVESLNGSVNAGSGVSVPVSVQAYYEDPITHIVYQSSPQIPFSGIVALTFPARVASYPAPTATLGNILVEAPNGDVNANLSGILQIPLNNFNYPNAITTVLAGYELRDSMGNPVTADDMADGMPVLVSADGNITANSSGIIASNVKLDASGDINGLIFARNNIDISAQQNVNVTALGVGNVTVSSGGTISGTIVGVGAVSVSGSSVDASLISANVSGATSSQSGLGQGTAANSVSQSASNDQSTKAAASSDSEDDEKNKKAKQIALAQKVSRVTVILPPKNLTEKKNAQNHL